MSANITSTPFGTTSAGQPVELFTLRNSRGVEARISNYGGILVSLLAPDRQGRFADVVLGYDDLAGYLRKTPYLGCLVGRYANRIALGRFTLDGVEYRLAQNNGANALHGGKIGFDKVVWRAAVVASPLGPTLRLSYLSPDGEEGYPGNLNVTADHTLTEDNGLRIAVTATTDKPTVVNITQHSYFNLAAAGDILGHEMQIHADRFTVINESSIPTGELRPVEGTPLDFRQPTAIGARIASEDEQLRCGKGYDHNFVVSKPPGKLALLARVCDPGSGRMLEVSSTAPGVQFYTGNYLDGSITGKYGRVYHRRSGFCLEPQHFPDSPNQPLFPSPILRPGERYEHTMIYRVGVA